jgi:putative tryptophan/tyrosine transport system substrate-binding protein
MKRRAFITLLAGGAAWPLAARAQQRPMPVIGFLTSYSSDDAFAQYSLPAFHHGLKEAGYIESRNVTIEYRGAEGRYDRLPALAADLVRRQVTVIVAVGGPSGPVAQASTTTIPIVFSGGGDPVKSGLVASLNRPGGNATGVVTLNAELGPKRLELLHELVPATDVIAVLLNPTYPVAETLSKELQEAARALGLQVHVLHASTERDIDAAFGALVRVQAGGLVVGTDPFFNRRMEQLAALALGHAVPTIYQYRAFAAAGGLISYGGNITDLYRQVGVYTGRVLAGAKPADLPVQQLTKVELIINLKTAKALGITVPLPLLGRADEVIE